MNIPVVAIIGLRRSGTTAFWKTLRKDDRFCCYDEPFNPNLVELPEDNAKGTRKEFISLYHFSPETFEKNFAPIPVSEEISPRMTTAQENYLRWLIQKDQGKRAIIIDFTRLNFKLAKLHAILPEAVVVHLYRSPRAWVSSHLLPSGKGTWSKPLADWYRRLSFWSRRGFYNNWGYQDIIENHLPKQPFWPMSRKETYAFKKQPAAVKLAWLWHLSFCVVESQGKNLWKERFLSVPFEHFCTDPGGELLPIYKAMNLDYRPLDYSDIKTANRGYRPDVRQWSFVDELGTDTTMRAILQAMKREPSCAT